MARIKIVGAAAAAFFGVVFTASAAQDFYPGAEATNEFISARKLLILIVNILHHLFFVKSPEILLVSSLGFTTSETVAVLMLFNLTRRTVIAI